MKLTPAALLPIAFLISCSESSPDLETDDLVNSANSDVTSAADEAADSSLGSERGPSYANTPGYQSPADYPNMTRDEQIRALKAEDPSSYGYTDSDRDLLRENGVSEAEARAMEDILAQQGIN